LFAVIIFGAAMFVRTKDAPLQLWLAVSANAFAGGAMIGWTIANIPVESLGVGGWSRSLALAAIAVAGPPVLSMAIMRNTPVPSFARILGPENARVRDPLAVLAGAILVITMLMAFVIALGLVFDPRYRDFPFAPLTAAVLPFVVHALVTTRQKGVRSVAETVGASVLALSVCYIVFNEGFANWQSLWLCAVLMALSINLARVHDVQG
jgi:glucan 1,3-beta-glucosidase